MKREAYPFARIAEHDYPAFRELLAREMPETYPGWLAMMKRRHYEEMFHGYDVKEVDVTPGAYAHFCIERGQPHDLKSLRDFVVEIASGRSS